MTSVSLPIMAACPSCRNLLSVNLTETMLRCNRCGCSWASRYYYDMVMATATGAPTPPYVAPAYTPVPPAPTPTDNYVTSGDMKKDVEAVVETVALETEFMTVKRIASKIAKMTEENYARDVDPQKSINDILVYITEEVKGAMKKNDKVMLDE